MKFFTGRPTLALVILSTLALLGVYSLWHSPVELVPDEKLPALTITAQWPGASPEMVMSRLALPIEEEVTGLKWIAQVHSRCRENHCQVSVECQRDADMNFVTVLLKERMNRLRSELPPQVAAPQVTPYVPEQFQKKAFMTLSFFGDSSVHTVRSRVDREVVPALKSLAGIQGLEVIGGVPMEVEVVLDLTRLQTLGLDPAAVAGAVSGAFPLSPSTAVRRQGREIALVLSQGAASLRDLERIRVGRCGGREVFLGDVATVQWGFQEITQEGRYNGLPTVLVSIVKQPRAPSLALSRQVRTVLAQALGKARGGLTCEVVGDESEELRSRLLELLRLSLLILLIVFLALLATVRDLRAALVIFSSVFFSVLATFTMVYLLKIPLNLLTLSGFALAFGMFVDNAVVVFDNILRLRQKGMDRQRAAIEGPRQVVVPVLASTLTTVIVFFTFAFFQDRLRVYYLPLAQIISLALAASVFVAFLLIPPLAARLDFRCRPQKEGAGRRGYLGLLRYPLFVLLPVAGLLVFSWLLFQKNVDFGRFFSWYERQRLYVSLELPEGSEFADTKRTLLEFERIAQEKPYAKKVNCQITENRASLEITFPPAIERSAAPFQLKQELIAQAANMAGVGLSVYGFDPEGYYHSLDYGSFYPYSIQIRGYDYAQLLRLAEELRQSLLLHRRIKEVSIETEPGFYGGAERKYFRLRPDWQALKARGLSPKELVFLLRSLIARRSGGGQLVVGEREYPLDIRFRQGEGLELTDLLTRELRVPGQTPFRLAEVLAVEEQRLRGGIARENQEFVAFVRWDYLGSTKAAERVRKAMFHNLTLPPGFKKVEEEERWAMKDEEKVQLTWAMGSAVLLIFLILGVLYQSVGQVFLIMLAIPLSLVGVFLAFVVAGFPFDSTAYVGVILLFGIAVNNSIILVDHLNFTVKTSGLPLRQAISQGAYERIRPIFLTTVTTVLGALPLVLSTKNGESDIWSALALCTVGGLTSSALLVLLVLPVCYLLLARLKEFARQRRRR